MAEAREPGPEPAAALPAPVIDLARLPGVAHFVSGQLALYDLSHLEWFKLLRLRRHVRFRGLCRYPAPGAEMHPEAAPGYRITASVQPDLGWPHVEPVPVAYEAARGADGRRRLVHLTREIRWRDAAECLVFVSGHEAFHFLRHTRQVGGRHSERAANRFGLEWLALWRSLAG